MHRFCPEAHMVCNSRGQIPYENRKKYNDEILFKINDIPFQYHVILYGLQ